MIRELTIGKYTFALRTIVTVAAIVALVIVCIAIPSCLQKRRSAAAQAKVEAAQGKAAVESGKDAINTAGNVSERQSKGEAIGRENERNIRNAQGSDTKVDSAAGRAGLDSLCRRASYRDSEQCRMLKSNPR